METAVHIDPRFPDALYYLGRMRLESNEPAKAKESFEQYLAIASKGAYAEEARHAIDGTAAPKKPAGARRKRGGARGR
jgi:hypothetical protein